MTAPKPPLDFDRIQVGETFGPLEYTITAEKLELYRRAVDDPDAVYSTIASKDYSTLLRTRYAVDKIVNARHQSHYLCPPAVGSKLKTTGRIADRYQKRDHKFIVVETTSVDENGRTLVVSRTTLMDGAPKENR